MTTYALLIYRTAPAAEALPELDEREALARHRALQRDAHESGDLHAVAQLDAPHSARNVRARANGHEIQRWTVHRSKEWLVGFYLVDCADEEQAVARAEGICVDPHHVIEVRPVNWRWRP